MSEQVSLGHSEAWNLIPWHVNGSLEGLEAEAFAAHLEGCAECRAEVEACSRLQNEVKRSENVAPAPHPSGLQGIWRRIDSESIEADDETSSSDWSESSNQARRRASGAAWRWVAAAQWLAILVLGGLLLSNPPADEPRVAAIEPLTTEPATQFRTLSDPERSSELGVTGDDAGAQRIRIVFAPPTTEQEIRQALLDVRAEIVGGPSPMGAYTIAVGAGVAATDPPEQLVEWLRQQPSVLFAEALSTPSAAEVSSR